MDFYGPFSEHPIGKALLSAFELLPDSQHNSENDIDLLDIQNPMAVLANVFVALCRWQDRYTADQERWKLEWCLKHKMQNFYTKAKDCLKGFYGEEYEMSLRDGEEVSISSSEELAAARESTLLDLHVRIRGLAELVAEGLEAVQDGLFHAPYPDLMALLWRMRHDDNVVVELV